MMMSGWRRRLGAGLLAVAASACNGDGDDQTSDQSGRISGQTVMTGPWRGASLAVDQLRLDDPQGGVREHVGDTVTDAEGRFELTGFGTLNGLFLVRASGGEFDDLATGTTIVLDPGAELRSLFWIDLFEDRTRVLVSPVGALVETLARQQLASGAVSNIGEARDVAADHIHRHFGDLDWSRIEPASLSDPAASPVPEWRAAALLHGYALLADDIRNAAGASPQEVNAHTLTRALINDLSTPPLDGNDGDERVTGLQLGVCPAVEPGCVVPPETPTFCPRGVCRTLCDIYSGTLRGLYSGAALKLVRSDVWNRSGIDDNAFLPTARAIAENTDPLLFGASCTDNVDRVGATITFDQPPTPIVDAWVKDAIQIRVRAVDDIDPAPDLMFLDGLVDDDGDPFNAVAAVTIDTAARSDGVLIVSAEARDAALNVTSASRAFRVDNTDPIVTLDSDGFVTIGPDWWTANPAPTLEGTITEANLERVTVYADGSLVADAVVTGGSWSLSLPAGTIPDVAGAEMRVDAIDLAGNVASVTRRIRHDATPPVLATVNTTVRDETLDAITFSDVTDPQGFPYYDPEHKHQGAVIPLGPATTCNGSAPTVTKHVYLLDEVRPAYVTESDGAAPGGGNPIQWRATLTDDGVGIDPAASAYQIRDVTSGTVLVPWRSIPGGVLVSGGRDYTVNVHRQGATWPSIPSLGTNEHTYEIAIRGRDLLGREVSLQRCWNQKLLPSPVYVGPRSQGGATSGNYGRYGFASLRLDDTASPIDPISTLVLNDNAPGVGLMQFPVYNVTTSPVYVAFDLRTPTMLSFQRDEVRGRWGETASSAVNINCDSVVVDPGPPVVYGPNESLPGCGGAAMGGAGTTGTASGPISATYNVRVFEEVGPAGELVPCLACAVTSMPPFSGDYQRFVVQLPARGAPTPVPLLPRKFWVQPSIQTVDELRPQGLSPPFAEIAFTNGAVATGKVLTTRIGCGFYQPPALVTGDWLCTRRSTNSQYTAVTRARIDFAFAIRVEIRTSRDGLALLVPDYFTQATRDWTDVQAPISASPLWNSSEILPPVF